jgi:hypothetical protein
MYNYKVKDYTLIKIIIAIINNNNLSTYSGFNINKASINIYIYKNILKSQIKE